MGCNRVGRAQPASPIAPIADPFYDTRLSNMDGPRTRFVCDTRLFVERSTRWAIGHAGNGTGVDLLDRPPGALAFDLVTVFHRAQKDRDSGSS